MKKSLMSITHVNKTYVDKPLWGEKKTHQVLTDINLTIYENEILGLVGESGCGKTTLGKILLGLLSPTSGTITYKGMELHSSQKLSNDLRSNIQMVFQDPFSCLDPKMNVADILMEPLKANRIYSTKKEATPFMEQLLITVGLKKEDLYRFPKEFSGGQRQRIGIARALSLQPDFIICDEPVSALDVSVQAQILNLLKTLQKEQNFSSLFISHDLGVVRYIADRVAIMYMGRICELGPAEEIYTHPRHPYTKMLLDAVPKMGILHEENVLLEDNEPTFKDIGTGCPFAPRCPYASSHCQNSFPSKTSTEHTIFYCHHPLE